MGSPKLKLKLDALVVASHVLCFDGFAGIAFGMNAIGSGCRVSSCTCARMSGGHAGPARGLSHAASPCSAHKSRPTPPQALKIAVPLPPFDLAPGSRRTASVPTSLHHPWAGYLELETPPPR